jgi:hypothetical protein
MSERWREQYDRLKRWQARLLEPSPVDDRHVDDYYAFFICCFHLKDWLGADPSLSPTIGPAAEAWVSNVRYLRLCADLANASKHLVIDRKPRIDPDIAMRAVHGAFQADAFQADAFQVNDEVIVVAGGDIYEGRYIVQMCVLNWELFLREQGLLENPASG